MGGKGEEGTGYKKCAQMQGFLDGASRDDRGIGSGGERGSEADVGGGGGERLECPECGGKPARVVELEDGGGVSASETTTTPCEAPIRRRKWRERPGRKRSINTKIVIVFIFFIANKIENGYFENGNDIDISETSETKVRYKKYIGNSRNLKFDR
jgi:hypothetical protein